MKILYVYGDFDWLESPILIGELGYESLRGSDSYAFKFDNYWLSKYGSILLSADLNNYSGWQYTKPENDIFGCFSDALPDRWGRTLLTRREELQAREEKRAVRKLSSFDFLIGIDDTSRMGGLRFKEAPDREFINCEKKLRIPPLTDIRNLISASLEFEHSEELHQLPDNKWIAQLLHPGSSLGGARPKACISDEHGQLWIAKFPSRNDDYDVALWEHLSHLLAKEAEIPTSQTRVINTGEKYHTLLSLRFDRENSGKRIHFASAMTMLGLTDGCDAKNGYGYLDIVDFILRHCCDVKENLHRLYRRIAFNIAIGNTDDHFRNHGFLLAKQGWTLAPAYDLNPTLNTYQSLLINSSTNEANLDILLNSCEEYMIPKTDAKQIIESVIKGVSKWKAIATSLNISKREISILEKCFNSKKR